MDDPNMYAYDDQYDRDDDESREPPEFGCCLPEGECCMPGLHFPSECHTAADYERAHPLDWRRADEVRADWEAELRRDAFGA